MSPLPLRSTTYREASSAAMPDGSGLIPWTSGAAEAPPAAAFQTEPSSFVQ